MSVWLTIPSARPNAGTVPLWRERGYKIAIFRDVYDPEEFPGYDLVVHKAYPGYARAVNMLTGYVMKMDPEASFCVAGGDDTLPDPNHSPAEIARQLTEHFGGTFGVMQPTADRFAHGSIDRIAGSPWLGREWCLRANGGAGPFWPQFLHMYSDECLKRTAEKLGVYWMRPDILHLHRHFMRKDDSLHSVAIPVPPPPHLARWNSQSHWDEAAAIFRRLEAEEFASCMPVPHEAVA